MQLDLDRPHEALELLREGHDLILASGTPPEIALYRIEEARALAALGEPEEAAALAMTAASELRGTHQVDAGRSYVLLGEIFAGIGDEERAQELLELAIELLEREGPSGYLVQAYKRLAAICRKRGDTEGALDVLERALSVNERVGRPIT